LIAAVQRLDNLIHRRRRLLAMKAATIGAG
jgi:hypothetical protein